MSDHVPEGMGEELMIRMNLWDHIAPVYASFIGGRGNKIWAPSGEWKQNQKMLEMSFGVRSGFF